MRQVTVGDVQPSSGSHYRTVLPSSYDNFHSITVNAEIKCNYASVYRSF